MTGNVEDLYLKGFMAFSSKDYKSARTYWERVLASDPNHEKAKKGMADLAAVGKPKKRSSKEVFQEIKRLYGLKKYSEALKLCRLLLKKHPDNKDLQSLQKKLENRVQTKGKEAPQKAAKAGGDFKSTMYIADAAALSVSQESETADTSSQVEKYIQEGVSLYEIQDYPLAIETWQKALALDPENRIAKDYIDNVQSLMDQTGHSVSQAAQESASTKPSKEALIEIYNEAMNLFKQSRYEEALEKWNYILQFHPNHQETLQCIERTKAVLEKAQAEAAPAPINAPPESANPQPSTQEKSSLDLDEEELNAIPSLEIEGAKQSAPAEDHSATDDEITRYFLPEEGPDQKARQVSKVVRPKREKKLNKFLVIGLPIILLILGGGGYFGYDAYNKMLKTTEEEVLYVPLVREIDWNSPQQRANDFLNLGSELADNNLPLLAYFSFLRVEEIAEPRLAQLQTMEQAGTNPSLDIQSEITRLKEILDRNKANVATIKDQIVAEETNSKDEERARTEIQLKRYEDAIVRLTALLSGQQDNEDLRTLLGETQQKLAFKRLADGDLDGGLEAFKKAQVLLPGYDMARRHHEVIQRYYQGKISAEEKDQWFFFFRE